MPEQETSISELVGRAWDDTRRRVPDLTVFTDAQDLVVGFATPGYPCDDVRCAQPRITSNYTGRERFARDDTIDTLRAYGIFFWVPIGPANLPKTLSGSNSPCAIQAALLVPPRRFPPPWSVEEAEACFIVKTDSAGHRHCLQQLQSPRNRYALRKLQKAQEPKSAFVFTSERGGAPFSRDSFNWMVKRAGKKAKLPFQVHAHMIRHATGYKLANAGKDTRSIQGYLLRATS